MVVDLPTWAAVATSTEPWVSGVITSMIPAAYWEIGLAVGVFIIAFVIAVVTGGLKALVGAFGYGSDPMRSIGSGNSGIGYSGHSGRSSYSVGRVSPMGTWAGSRWTKTDRKIGLNPFANPFSGGKTKTAASAKKTSETRSVFIDGQRHEYKV